MALSLVVKYAPLRLLEVHGLRADRTFTLSPSLVSPNLDAKLTLLDASGSQLATADPPTLMTTRDTATGMAASLTYNFTQANTYYLSVAGVGSLNPLTTGYSSYGSVGRYELGGQL